MVFWDFPSANNTGTYGLRSYQEQFKDNPMLSLAKEICQNSLDAVNDETKPVTVEFSFFYTPSRKMPGKDNFIDILKKCLDFTKNTYKNNEAKDFYSDAIGILENDEFPCLRISDFNTKGLTGSDNDDNSDWTNLVKAIGVSDKGDGKGGSFGHGKFATFACSYLQTVFYSTNSIDGAKVSQGVARLSTFKNENNEKTMGLGYYGNAKCSKINQIFNIDEDYNRPSTEYGTDIFILGFNDEICSWQEKIVASVLDTFFVAICMNKLIFKMGKDVCITSSNIKDYIFNEKYSEFLNENTKYNFCAFCDTEKQYIFTASIINKDDVHLFFEKFDDPECNNKVAMVRNNGMKIYDQDRNPKSPFYGATLYITNPKTDGYFRKLENPQHNGWAVERAKDVDETRARIRAIKRFIKECVNKFIEENRPESIDVSGLSEFLPDDIQISSDANNNSENLAEEKNKKVEVIKKDILKKDALSPEQKDITDELIIEVLKEEEDSDLPELIIPIPVDPSPNPPKPGPSPNPLPPIPTPFEKEYKQIKGTKSFMFYNSGYYNLSFGIDTNIESLKLEFTISGETIESDDLIISEAKYPGLFGKRGILINKNTILLTKIPNTSEVKLLFKIESDEIWPIEVKYYAIEK